MRKFCALLNTRGARVDCTARADCADCANRDDCVNRADCANRADSAHFDSARARANRGETLIETLVALLIAVVVLCALATSVVVASKINVEVGQMDTSLVYPDEGAASGQAITVTIKTADDITTKGSGTATMYTDASGNYVYYEGPYAND